MRVQIIKLNNDDPPHVEISISNDDFAARQDSYVNDDEWLEFGIALQSFPTHVKQEVTFKSGAPGDKYYCYVVLRAFVYDGVGHSALEVKMENHLAPPYKAAAHFHILCEPNLLNRFGHSLASWVVSGNSEFEFSRDII